jgi:formylglycine-generating enzyme required for sulfatase activity
MAGNVSEWTATLDEDPEMPGEQIPVIRGGNWKNPGEPTATRRVIKLDELMTDETLGFRTVSDTPPAPAQ